MIEPYALYSDPTCRWSAYQHKTPFVPFTTQQVLMLAAILNLVSGATAMLRGSIFTYINQIIYTHTYRSFLRNLCAASMSKWDTEYNQEELSKCALSDMAEVIFSSSVFVNVVSRTLATLVAGIFMLRNTSVELIILCGVATTIQVVCIHFMYRYYSPFNEFSVKIQRKQEDNANQYILNHVNIQLYSMQPMYIDIFESQAIEHANVIVKEKIVYAMVICCNQVIPTMLELVFIYFIFYFGQASRAIEMVAYYKMIMEAIRALKEFLQGIVRTRDQAFRVKKYLQTLQNRPFSEKACIEKSHKSHEPPTITFENVTFAYPTRPEKLLFQDFDLEIRPREQWAIVAKSGVGKSTLIKILLHMYPLVHGQVRIGNRDVSTLTTHELSQWISIIPQEPLYFPQKTLRENILLYCTATDVELKNVLLRSQLDEWTNVVDEKLTALSGGQKQRLAIARMLIRNTPIVILDEPTSALDEHNTRCVMQEILHHCQDKTVILITHNPSLIPENMRPRCIEYKHDQE